MPFVTSRMVTAVVTVRLSSDSEGTAPIPRKTSRVKYFSLRG